MQTLTCLQNVGDLCRSTVPVKPVLLPYTSSKKSISTIILTAQQALFTFQDKPLALSIDGLPN